VLLPHSSSQSGQESSQHGSGCRPDSGNTQTDPSPQYQEQCTEELKVTGKFTHYIPVHSEVHSKDSKSSHTAVVVVEQDSSASGNNPLVSIQSANMCKPGVRHTRAPHRAATASTVLTVIYQTHQQPNWKPNSHHCWQTSGCRGTMGHPNHH
jgi:hypothetical protein